jgi:hypothetical protein
MTAAEAQAAGVRDAYRVRNDLDGVIPVQVAHQGRIALVGAVRDGPAVSQTGRLSSR